ncbi:hypothetical protein [Parasulfitobacter algicola]|uniref:Hint domain-containing protein n=1 Tax=Parasulfitobacter algicola TaxID=2614809 RepID=A0ABX2J134_9RHOB|nr:hypothetical protein [Sulfitobacter algicola]NSX56904.1 hypothetical protein [Sulfitobacter algicola]
MANRGLTEGEIELAQALFGDAIDYSTIRIFDRGYQNIANEVTSPNGNIYYPREGRGEEFYSDDFSTASISKQAYFMHELAHVWQYQNGTNLIFRRIVEGGDYDYTDKLTSGVPFSEWGIEEQASYFEDVFRGAYGYTTRYKVPLEELLNVDPGIAGFVENISSRCFLAGTRVSMFEADMKPIEDIQPGDVVQSYDASGNLVPGRVVRTFQKDVAHLLDVHGLKVTPGHVTLCGDGQFAGRHVPIIDILLSDGALVKEDGSLIRMAINKPLGSLEDQFVKVAYALTSEDARSGNLQHGKMRVGTLLCDRDGAQVSVLDCIRADNMTFDADTGLVAREGQAPEPLYFFGALPRPEDYILRRSRETLESILIDGEWEGSPSELIAKRLQYADKLRVN